MKNGNGRADGGHRWISEAAEVLVQEVEVAPPGALHCEVLVIGSGYGGAVAAARLAGARPCSSPADETPKPPVRVYVLERGNEYLPGEFPATFGELPGHVRFSRGDGQPARGNASGLFDIRLGGKVNALLGSGLGGGSLINAAVMERATQDAFAGSAWPAGIDRQSLAPHYARAEAMLGIEQIPGSVSKLDSLLAAGRQMRARTRRRAWVAIAFREHTRTAANVAMHPCLQCGDCVSGCNHRAKKSLDTNYLALARARGARLFCGATVHRILPLPEEDGYAVEFFFTDRRKARTDNARPYVLRAQRVVLAAGTLGSTEILLRSKKQGGLPVADKALGAGFSTNGDMIAVACDQKQEALSSALEGDAPAERHIGPTITGLLRTAPKKGERPLVIEEFAIPAPLRRLLAEVVATTDALQGLARMDLDLHAPHEQKPDPLGVDDEVLRRTPVYGMMGDDGAGGTIHFTGDDMPMADAQVRIDWDEVAEHPVFQAQMTALHAAHDAFHGLGGRVLPNPLWSPLPPFQVLGDPPPALGAVTTVHPLGGCRMSDHRETGVVDGWGRVYSSEGATQVPLCGLAVLDGSIVPVSLGINPSLTIAALAERAIPMLAEDWDLELLEATQPAASERPLRRDLTRPRAPAKTVVSMQERMTGRVRIDGSDFDLSAEVLFEPAEIQSLRTLPRALKQTAVVRFGRGEAASEVQCEGIASILVREKCDGVVRILRTHQLARSKLGKLIGTGDLSSESTSDLLALCSHLGAARLIQYDWTVLAAPNGSPLRPGDRLRLTKRIEFVEGGNPWRQLSEGELELIRPAGPERLGRLVLDPSYFVEKLQPLLRIEQQEDQPNQLGDLIELALWVLRVVLQIHLLDFLPPPDQNKRVDQRLPGAVGAVEPVRFPVEPAAAAAAAAVADARPPVQRLLSRYRPPLRRTGTRPVLLIHGYGASGSTFAHESIPGNLVAALLDAGRDVWVLDLRTSIGFTGPRRYWSFDEVAMADIPDAIETLRRAYADSGDGKVDVVAHCIGAAMFSVAVLRSPDLHERIGAVVLSQVGPLLRATGFNRFRGFVASYLQQYIGVEQFDTRPAGLSPSMSFLVDGLLATFPYPDGDGEAGRLKRVPGFAVVRHRADAIFGQTMRLRNVGDATLQALDAIYGFVMVRGLAQVAHYAREQVLTDAGGQNQAVAFERLGERFGFPLLLLHGRQNAVFDWRGSYDSFWLLKRVFGKDGGLPQKPPEPPEGDLALGQGTPRRLLVLGEYGHQDTLIGEKACEDVFPRIVGFLDEFRTLPGSGSPNPPEWVARLPATGPWLGHVTRHIDQPGRLHCRLALRPPPAHATARCVVFVPARREGERWNFDTASMVAMETTRETLLQEALHVELFDARLGDYQGFAVLTAHDDLPVDRTAVDILGAKLAGTLFAQPDRAPIDEIREQVERRLASASVQQLASAVIRLDAAWTGAAQPAESPAQASLSFALASCQYVPGLVDRLPAQASMARLARRLEASSATAKPQLLLLVGDQVYVDQSAGLFVPAGGDDVGQAYALNFGLQALREVAASMPCYPLLDDHEVMDDWEPGDDPYGEPGTAAALGAYAAQQHKLVHGARPDSTDQRPFDYRIAPAGFPFFMLDTRSLRERRALRNTGSAKPLHRAAIRTPSSMDDLRTWLEASPADLPKFVVSPVALFPLPRAAAFGDPAERLGLDDWSGYPASQQALLELLRDSSARNVVILSGDRHMSSVSSLWLEGASGPVEVISIVSSGLYAPWPFINARPDEFWLDGPLEVRFPTGTLQATMATAAVGTRDGYAVVRVDRDRGGHWQISVTLDLEGGTTRCTRSLDPAGDRSWKVEGPARFARSPSTRP
ncbi:alpha/beta fold hydrolase [Variovorax fucosicus]|uniref:alpha/beta fold hydrolase n=1 Tax=Variovorax fucosicus TaxID=3053517 RepID=UPI0025768006|nr:alpha/beta fold hydrolase [Variovorax sp. J22G47]MDM0057750.1 alkaline phosphatase D family protein [Variovorax sp. J22G47]